MIYTTIGHGDRPPRLSNLLSNTVVVNKILQLESVYFTLKEQQLQPNQQRHQHQRQLKRQQQQQRRQHQQQQKRQQQQQQKHKQQQQKHKQPQLKQRVPALQRPLLINLVPQGNVSSFSNQKL